MREVPRLRVEGHVHVTVRHLHLFAADDVQIAGDFVERELAVNATRIVRCFGAIAVVAARRQIVRGGAMVAGIVGDALEDDLLVKCRNAQENEVNIANESRNRRQFEWGKELLYRQRMPLLAQIRIHALNVVEMLALLRAQIPPRVVFRQDAKRQLTSRIEIIGANGAAWRCHRDVDVYLQSLIHRDVRLEAKHQLTVVVPLDLLVDQEHDDQATEYRYWTEIW